MWLTRLALNRPLVIVMFTAALGMLGLMALFKMPADLNPRVDLPFLTVLTAYPGASPQQVESVVTSPLEDAVGATPGLETLKSSSQQGLSILEIQLQLGANLDSAAADVRQKIESARQALPHEVLQPVVLKEDINARPIFVLGLKGSRPATELRRIADEQVKVRLGRIPGVASVDITGGDVREIQVELDRDRLAAYGLSAEVVASALQSASLDVPAGSIQQSGRNYSIRMVGEFSSLDAIRSVGLPAVQAASQGIPVHPLTLGDVASVTDGLKPRTSLTRVDLVDSVGLSVVKLPEANTVAVANEVRKAIREMKDGLRAQGAELVISQDQSVLIEEALSDITSSLLLGALLATLVVYLFLHDWRGTVIIACAIPTSLVVTFLVMHTAHFTLNQMTMLGLSIAVGILVDDSILVLENIHRHLQRGEPPREAAFNGRTEIGLADITTTLVDVVVFVPIAFMGGIVGQFFKQFGLTVATATLTSMFVSFSFTPMLASRWYRSRRPREEFTGLAAAFNRFYDGLDALYRRLLARALAHRLTVIGFAAAALALAMAIGAVFLSFEFIPTVDEGRLQVSIQLPVSATLEDTDRLTRRAEAIVATDADVRSIFTTVGQLGGGWRSFPQHGPSYAQLDVSLYEKPGFLERLNPLTARRGRQRSDLAIARELDAKLTSTVAGARISVSTVRGVEGNSSPVELDLYGQDSASLQKVANVLVQVLRNTPGIYDVDSSVQLGRPEVQVTPDRVRMAVLGIRVEQLGAALRTSLEGNTETHFLDPRDGKSSAVRVRYSHADRQDVEQVKRVLVSRPGGGTVLVEDIASVEPAEGPTQIDHKDRQRVVVVAANLVPGHPLGDVKKAVDRKLSVLQLPELASGKVRWEWGGDTKQMVSNAIFMATAILISIALVYMLMAALFDSLLHPLTIMLSLPMALAGGVLALVLFGSSLNIVAMIGFIMLVGMVGKNAILLVDYTNTLRARGKTTTQALLEAGPTRLRPILMTTLTVVTGMLPTALGIGRASEMRSPMAIAVLGGLILSTLLTLVVIPVCYSLFDDVFSRN